MSIQSIATIFITTAQQIVQIAFFITVATVTVLTYRRAKHTILQPLRTEAFKEQVAELRKSLVMIGEKDEVDLRKMYDFDGIITANLFFVLDTYAKIFFGAQPDEDSRPYGKKNCPAAIIHESQLRSYDISRFQGGEEPAEASPVLAWPDHIKGTIFLTSAHLAGKKQVEPDFGIAASAQPLTVDP